MKKKFTFFLIFFALFSIAAAFADTAAPTAPSTPAPQKTEQPAQTLPIPSSMSEELTNSYESSFGKMIFSLVGLFLLIILSIWFLRKMSSSRYSQGSYQKSLKILERKPLSAKSTLFVIEAMGKKVLIAESQWEVRSLSEIEEPIINSEEK